MYTETVRVYPDESQKELIDEILKTSCDLYNYLLDQHERAYWLRGETLNHHKYDKYAQEFCYVHKLPNVVRQYVDYRLASSFSRYFNKVSKYPKHKSLKKFRSFATLKINNGRHTVGCHVDYNSKNPNESIVQVTNKLKLKAHMSRPLTGPVRMIIIKKMKTNVYYAFLQIDGDAPKRKFDKRKRKKVIAIDLGVNKFLTDQLGNYVPQPRFVEYNEKKIRAEQRKLSRMVYGSNNYKKRCEIIARMYEKISNIRKDWQYKLAYYLVTNYKTIVCENLDVSEMLRKKPHTKYLSKVRRLLKSCGIQQFIEILDHMCKKYDCQLIKVNPQNTSQLCSNCGAYVSKSPGQHHDCPHCGLQADRDINAARNIYERGLGRKFSGGTTVGGAPAPLVLVNQITINE